MNSPVISNIILDDITFKKPEKLSKKLIIIPITYKKTNRLIIQTPKFLIPEVPVIYCHRKIKFYKLKICAFNYAFEDYVIDYVKKINSIDKFIKEKSKNFISKYNIENNFSNYVPSLYYNRDKTKVNFYVNLQMLNNKPAVSVFDWEKKKRDMSYLMPHSLAYSVLWLQNIWFKDDKVGLNWVILQMKVYLPIYKIDECIIVDDLENQVDSEPKSDINTNNSSSTKKGIMLKDHPVYSKYFNMKRFKIPIPAIQNKLKMNNLDPNIILKDETEYYEEISESKSNTTPKKPNNILINNNMFSKISLKKTVINKKPAKNTGPVVSQNGMRPPTLDEILNMKNALNKTGKVLC